jgi:hypothetical protein
MSEPYQIMDRILRKQVAAKPQKLLTRTIYANAYEAAPITLALTFRGPLLGGSKRRKDSITPVHCTELYLAMRGVQSASQSWRQRIGLIGLNDIGIVTWRCTLRTPYFFSGRDTISIGNDFSFSSGSFSS